MYDIDIRGVYGQHLNQWIKIKENVYFLSILFKRNESYVGDYNVEQFHYWIIDMEHRKNQIFWSVRIESTDVYFFRFSLFFNMPILFLSLHKKTYQSIRDTWTREYIDIDCVWHNHFHFRENCKISFSFNAIPHTVSDSMLLFHSNILFHFFFCILYGSHYPRLEI